MIRLLWSQHSQEKDWGFILIDVRSAFNQENQRSMIWADRNECPSGAQLNFNCHCHGATLVVRNSEKSGHFLHSKEGMTHGDPKP